MVHTELSRKLAGIDDNSLLVFSTDDFMYFTSCVDLVESLVEDYDMEGVVLIINKHVEAFVSEMDKKGIPHHNIWFIDCISAISGFGQPAIKNCITVSHPSNNQEILVSITQALSRINSKKKKFVLFVSPHILTQYISTDEMGVFFNQFKTFLHDQKIFDIIMLERAANESFESLILDLADSKLET